MHPFFYFILSITNLVSIYFHYFCVTPLCDKLTVSVICFVVLTWAFLIYKKTLWGKIGIILILILNISYFTFSPKTNFSHTEIQKFHDFFN